MTLKTASRKDIRVSSARGHRGYNNQLLKFCQKHHLLGQSVPLTEVLVEPRFVTAPPLVAPIDENLTQSIFFSVPFVADYPFLHAHYNILTQSIEELGKGDSAIALLGLKGSGRTTALLAIALWSMGQIDYTIPPDSVQERLKNEEQALSQEERAERVKNRVVIAQQARQRFVEDKGKTYLDSMTEEDEKTKALPTFRRLAPLYIHLSNVIVNSQEYGRTIDPAEPLVRGLQAQVSALTAKTMPRTLYRLLREGQALVLIDGLDDVPVAERAEKMVWLQGFIKHYAQNFIVVTAPPQGSSHLADIGFTCVHLRPWQSATTQQYTEKIVHLWRKLKNTDEPSLEALKALQQKGRFLNPFDYTLRLLASNQGNESEHIKRHLQSLLTDYEALLPQLHQLARLEIEKGAITRQQLIALAMLTSDMPAESNEDAPPTDEAKPSETAGVTEKRQRQVAREQTQLLEKLVTKGVLMHFRNGRYRFTYGSFTAYLMASQLTVEALQTQHHNADWDTTLCYANQFLSLERWVIELLAQPQDVALQTLLKLTQWLKYAGTSATWRNHVLKLLANWLVAPHQYLVLRERIASALVSSGDESVLVVFRKMTQNPNADVRRVACFALGALRDIDASRPLAEIAMDDSDGGVQVAATLALGAIATPPAIQTLADILEQSANADVQRACAESLANFPEDGYPALVDAINSPETMVRRATVWGLGRLKTDWSLIYLNEVYLKDTEWYVQTASVQVFMDVYEEGQQGVHRYPPINEIEWLQIWTRQGIKLGVVPMTLHDVPLLQFAINYQADAMNRLMCIALTGQLGILEATESLYKALYDNQEAIRDAAYRSLCDLALGWQTALPMV